jgi:hypothetical protein
MLLGADAAKKLIQIMHDSHVSLAFKADPNA